MPSLVPSVVFIKIEGFDWIPSRIDHVRERGLTISQASEDRRLKKRTEVFNGIFRNYFTDPLSRMKTRLRIQPRVSSPSKSSDPQTLPRWTATPQWVPSPCGLSHGSHEELFLSKIWVTPPSTRGSTALKKELPGPPIPQSVCVTAQRWRFRFPPPYSVG